MVDADGHVKIVDFGLAKLVEGDLVQPSATRTRMTTPGVVMATIGFMSLCQSGQDISIPSAHRTSRGAAGRAYLPDCRHRRRAPGRTAEVSLERTSGRRMHQLFAGTREVYSQDDRFDPDRMLNLLAQYHEESVARGFPAARVIGEMTPEVQQMKGGDRLLEYEARVSYEKSYIQRRQRLHE